MIRKNASALKRLDNLVRLALSRATGAGLAAGAGVITQDDEVVCGPLTGTTTSPITVAAWDVTPVKSGLYLVGFTLPFVLSAADTVSWNIEAVPLVTAITGGTAIRSTFHYESTSPLVVAGGTPVNAGLYTQEIATGDITAQTPTLCMAAVTPGAIGTRQALVLFVKTAAGAHLTTLEISNAFALEL
jgi:hypothetical protein